jgi:adenylyltransferase/sulfurtransferase
MTPEEATRYSRQIILPGFGLEAQQKLAASKVLVVGMGGLGSPVALYLAAAGVGELGLCDFDEVALHNLHRQILHGTKDVERLKVESARERLGALNPQVKLNLHPQGVQAGQAVELFQQYDLIVDGTDNFPVRYLNNDAAFFAGKPLVYGSIFQFEGQVTLFDPRRGGPCYRCLFPQMPEPGSVPNCAEAGVMGALCGVIGSLQAMEALKWITGLGDSLNGTILCYDALRSRFRKVKIKPDPDCPLCGKFASIQGIDAINYQWSCETETKVAMNDPQEIPIEVDVKTVHQRLSGSGKTKPIILDVREDFERDICKINGSVAIPMGQIADKWQNLDSNQEWIVHCHHGMRSLRVTQFLRERGFRHVQNMAGGIQAWARQIEPGMRKY